MYRTVEQAQEQRPRAKYQIKPDLSLNFQQPVYVGQINLCPQQTGNTGALLTLGAALVPFVPDILKWFRRRW